MGIKPTLSPPLVNWKCAGARHVAEIGRRLEIDFRQSLERQPVISAVDHRFEDWSQPHIGIGDPLERLAVDGSRRGRGLEGAFPGAVASAFRGVAVTTATRSTTRATRPARRRSAAIVGRRTPRRATSHRHRIAHICFIASASASRSAATSSCVNARSHWPTTHSN